jgi:predicted amidohydrolase YtcJ
MGGALVDVALRGGRIIAIASRLPPTSRDIDSAGCHLLPGLADHHIHLLATAARMTSASLDGLADERAVKLRLRAHAHALPPGAWLRATGYDERAAGLPNRAMLDAWMPDRPLRLQDRTGALWVLNSAGLAELGNEPWPDCVEREGGLPTGRIWRGDAWLRERIQALPPSLAQLSAKLATHGITCITDATAHNGPAEAALLTDAVASGALRQRLTLMGREELPAGTSYVLGPVKLLLDERDLPDVETISERIRAARALGRSVAAHAVTVSELLLFLAALDGAGGACPGDRIEHGSLIPASLIPDLAAAGLTVVANPGFIATRGDRYMAQVPPHEQADLHRLASLAKAGVLLAAGSDAPYGPPDPWIAIRAAVDRRTASGAHLNPAEALPHSAALSLWLGDPATPAGLPRTAVVGAPADLCIIDPRAMAEGENPVRMTIIAGDIVFASSGR